MKGELKDFISSCTRFFADKTKFRLVLLGILGIYCLSEFLILGLARRTFVFYAISNGKMTVEDRMLKRSRSKEQNIIRYVDEAVLGPVIPDLLPLFPKDTRVLSLLYRDNVVYINFSGEAALPPEEGGEVFKNLNILYTGIKRNFSYVNDVCFFIEGIEAYSGEFRQIFSEKTGG